MTILVLAGRDDIDSASFYFSRPLNFLSLSFNLPGLLPVSCRGQILFSAEE